MHFMSWAASRSSGSCCECLKVSLCCSFLMSFSVAMLLYIWMTLLQVASWGGYSFIINLLPIHCLACIFLGRMNSRLYVAYAPFIVLGTIEAASIPVVGFNAVLMSEHFGSFLAFGVLHAALGMQYIKVTLIAANYDAAAVSATYFKQLVYAKCCHVNDGSQGHTESVRSL